MRAAVESHEVLRSGFGPARSPVLTRGRSKRTGTDSFNDFSFSLLLWHQEVKVWRRPPEDPTRSILGATMMITQSFLYNAIFFTATLVLGKFYGVASEDTPLYLIAFAVGNLVGPLVLGHFFDTIGRRKMIAITYVTSGALLAISAFLFYAGALNAITQTIAWCVIFFFASAGASSAYLTVSEIFPMEVRAKAIAVFFAIAQCFGAIAPVIYGALIGDVSDPSKLF